MTSINQTTLFCDFCQLPFEATWKSDHFCSYGCRLASMSHVSRLKFLYLLAGVVFSLLAYTLHMLDQITEAKWDSSMIEIILTSAGIILLAPPLFKQTFFAILKKQIIADYLIFLALVVAVGGSIQYYSANHLFYYIDFTALLLVIIPLSQYWEARLRKKSLDDLHKILSLRVLKARLIRGQTETEIAIESLKIGDMIRVYPGEIIPCDGLIQSGTTRVDESDLIGNPSPIFRGKGDSVRRGSLNQDSAITIMLVNNLEEHFIERMIRHLDSSRKTPLHLQRLTNILLASLMLIILSSSLALFIYLTKMGSELALLPVLSILVVSPFFSIKRAIPIAINFGMGRALRKGIVVKSGKTFFNTARLNTLFFEKTGVISGGEFHYTQLFLENGVNQGELLTTCFSLALLSEHPIAKGMTTHPWHPEIQKLKVKNFKEHPGLGICGFLSEPGKKEIFSAMGNVRFLRRFQMQISPAMREKIDQLEVMGETVVLCGWEGVIRGLLSFSDTLRPDIKPMLNQLQSLSITPVLVTGDHEEMMSHLTHTQGLNQIYTRCLPDEKIKRIKKFEAEGNRVGYVGTSYDDIGILTQAFVSIIFNAKTSQPIGVTSALIFGQRLLSVAHLLQISKKTRRIAMLNLSLGFIQSLGGLVLASFNLLSPQAAILIMAGTSLLLTLIPFRLKLAKLN